MRAGGTLRLGVRGKSETEIIGKQSEAPGVTSCLTEAKTFQESEPNVVSDHADLIRHPATRIQPPNLFSFDAVSILDAIKGKKNILESFLQVICIARYTIFRDIIHPSDDTRTL
jgi:hypothetical protein